MENIRIGGDCKHGRRPDVCKECNPEVSGGKLANPYSKHHCQACEIDRVTACSGCIHDAYDEGAQMQAKELVEWGVEWCPGGQGHPKEKILRRKCAECWDELRRQMRLK